MYKRPLIQPAGTMMLDFPASKTERETSVVYKLPSLWYFVSSPGGLHTCILTYTHICSVGEEGGGGNRKKLLVIPKSRYFYFSLLSCF